MRYPRQVSMPSGIQLWLEEQLEARGIDSRVYSNYILGVLSNDSSELSVKPKDRQVRILIDELRAKLKGLQEKGQFPKTFQSLEGDNPQAPQEEGFSYYSALPPSNSKPKPDQINSSLASLPGVWSGKRAFGSSVGKNRTISEGNNRDSKFQSFNWLEEDKENNGFNRDVKEKMRSRSTVKQQTPEKNRNMAKSLDRKEDVSRRPDTTKSRRLYQQPLESTNDSHILWKNEKSFDDLSGCDQDLPMDFQQLLESPESTKMSFDYSRSTGTKQPPSFIQCGTNITSSIWSEKAEDKMDCSMIGETNNNVSLNMSLDNSAWGGMGEASINKPAVLQETASIFNTSIWSTGNPCVFNDDSWKTVGNSKATSGEVGKWSDVEGTRLLLNDSDNFFSTIGTNFGSSLNTLNHNKEDSSFTEVIPKMQLGFATKEIINVEPATFRDESTSAKKEEEDLLTSMKTHFRPIKHDVIEVVSSNTAPSFPDGATFPISSGLDELNFHRSPGGGLYLDSDMTNKYMEYVDAKDDTPSEFVPKFRVKKQNEKFCQTDEFVPSAQNYAELESEEMYFPEDEKLVRSMVEEDEIEEEEENVFWSGETCIKVDGWMATWPTSGIWSNEPNVQEIWCGRNVVWNSAGAGSAAAMGATDGGGQDQGQGQGEQYTQLRNEWTQEAEELLSDISQHLYLANYVDTQPPKTTLVESAWNQLSSAPFPLSASYSLMQS